MTYMQIMDVVRPAVCAQLKCPASAQFPLDTLQISGDDFNGYKVTGYVDSQNSYGAMIRNDYTAFVAVNNGYPVVRSAQVGVKTNTANAVSFGVIFLILSLVTTIGGVLLYLLISVLIK